MSPLLSGLAHGLLRLAQILVFLPFRNSWVKALTQAAITTRLTL
jgi:hypothetical protein